MEDDGDPIEQFSQMWSRAALTYGHAGPEFFQYFGRRLVEFAGIFEGASVLDVACGRGAILFPAAHRVGPGGEVVGVDFSEGMVAETSAEIHSRGLTNARVLRMNAERLDFPGSAFDFVTCGFALFFFPHLPEAMAGFHRVLKPGGKLVVSTWGRRDPRWQWIEAWMKKADPGPQDRRSDEPSFDSPGWMADLFARSGFGAVSVQPVESTFTYTNYASYWDTLWSHGARASLERLTPEQLEQARAYSLEKMASYAGPEGIPQWMEALLTRGTKP